MNRFSSLLRNINERMDIPQPAKSRILLEISADLEDAYNLYVEQGFSDQDATRLAQEKFILDDEAIDELVRIHQSSLKRWLDRFSLQMQSRWERVILILTLLSIAAISGQLVVSSQFFRNSSVFVWPIWGVSVIGVILFFYKYYRIYILKDHFIKTARKGIVGFLFLGLASLLLGTIGYFYELFLAGVNSILPGSSLITVVCTVPDTQEKLVSIVECFIKCSSVMMVSLMVTLFLALFWYVMISKIGLIERAEAESLLMN